MRIVVDAMGSDEYPVPDVAGAVSAAKTWSDDQIVLVGRADAIEEELADLDTAGLGLEIIHAPDVIEMDDEPAWGAREKRQSSMHVGMGLVGHGEADAYVSAGNTGGVLAVATLYTLKRIRGVKRPALAAILPLPAGRFVTLDIGANADCKPEYLVQFALMGTVYARAVLGRSHPRVALLSNGEERGKGNELVKEATGLLEESGLPFVGNVEAKEALACEADVVVHDGFTGNIFIKTIEATASMLTGLIREEIGASWVTGMGGLLAKPAFKRVARRVDPFEVGGGPLLGVNGVVIVAHGRSNARAIKNAIGQARQAVMGGVVEAIRGGLS
ncbi:MAG: phosphate acyltransferase PlsX [Chloroflexota bacterium]|nr:phosphate acyltransferase PlsX [Chloroflexota bacterium]